MRTPTPNAEIVGISGFKVVGPGGLEPPTKGL